MSAEDAVEGLQRKRFAACKQLCHIENENNVVVMCHHSQQKLAGESVHEWRRSNNTRSIYREYFGNGINYGGKPFGAGVEDNDTCRG